MWFDIVWLCRSIFTKADLMKKTKKIQLPPGWTFSSANSDDYDAGIDEKVKHSGTRCVFLKSVVPEARPLAYLSQGFSPEPYLGKRLRMSAWVKSNCQGGRAQLWLRIAGDWASTNAKPNCFDNMEDRPILDVTDWTQYKIVVEVPDTSTYIDFGLMLNGVGQAWVDDFSFETVGEDVELTTSSDNAKSEPFNLNFEVSK